MVVMAAVGLVIRSLLRRRWRGLVLVVALVAFAGGVTLVALAGARRTASSFDRFLEASKTHHVLVFTDDIRASDMTRIRAIPGVETVGRARFLAVVGEHGMLSVGFAVVGPLDDVVFRDVFRPRIIEGRATRRGAAEEVVIGETFARGSGLHVGDSLPIRSYTPDQTLVITSGTEVTDPQGPRVRLRVVGISRSPSDLSLQGQVGGELFLSRAFVRKYGSSIGNYYGPHGAVLGVRLERGAAGVPHFLQQLREVVRDHSFDLDPRALSVGGVQESIDVLAVAILIFGIVAGVAGIVSIALVCARQLALLSAELVGVHALGMRRRQRAAAIAVPSLVATALGVGVAVLGAWLASPLMPFGVARQAEPSPGFAFDPLVLGLGGVATFLALAAIVGVAAWRITRTETAAVQQPLRPAAVTRALETLGMPAPVTVGAHMALEPGRGRTAVPVRSTFVGATLAIVGIMAVIVFSASLTHLVDTPAAHGQAWDASVVDRRAELARAGDQCGPATTRLLHDPEVAAIGSACSAPITLEGRPIGAIAVTPLRGTLRPTVLEGRLPRSRQEVALGAETLRALHLDVGDHARVRSPKRPIPYRIVGPVIVPSVTDPQAIADGAVLTGPGLQRIPHSDADVTFAFVVRFRPGIDERAAAARIERLPGIGAFGHPGVQLTGVPLEVRRLDQVDWIPAALAAFLAILGALAVGHLLVTNLRRRRRDFAVLKTLGCGRRQILTMVAWQATTVAAVAIIVGAVVGILAGSALWHAAASSVGVARAVDLPLVALAGVAIGSLVLANLIALFPGRAAATTPVATTLRTE